MIPKEMLEAAAKIIDPDAWITEPDPEVCFCERCREDRQLQREASMATAERALTAALSSQWRGIESAPKDGTEILGWANDGDIYIIWWNDAGSDPATGWFESATFYFGPSLTHWQPLPPPPSQE